MKSSVEPSELRLKVHLYGEPSSNTLDLQEVAGYLKEKLGKISVDVRGPLVAATSSEDAESLARKLAEAKVRDLTNPSVRTEPLPGEVEFELKLLRDPSLRSAGVLYDGFRLHAVVQELLPAGELDMDHAHIVFTNRLFGTWDEGDGKVSCARQHLRLPIINLHHGDRRGSSQAQGVLHTEAAVCSPWRPDPTRGA